MCCKILYLYNLQYSKVCNIQGMKPLSKPSSKVLEFENNVPKPKPTIEFRNLKTKLKPTPKEGFFFNFMKQYWNLKHIGEFKAMGLLHIKFVHKLMKIYLLMKGVCLCWLFCSSHWNLQKQVPCTMHLVPMEAFIEFLVYIVFHKLICTVWLNVTCHLVNYI